MPQCIKVGRLARLSAALLMSRSTPLAAFMRCDCAFNLTHSWENINSGESPREASSSNCSLPCQLSACGCAVWRSAAVLRQSLRHRSQFYRCNLFVPRQQQESFVVTVREFHIEVWSALIPPHARRPAKTAYDHSTGELWYAHQLAGSLRCKGIEMPVPEWLAWIKSMAMGAVLGAVITAGAGFGSGDWLLRDEAEGLAQRRAAKAVAAALVPLCVRKSAAHPKMLEHLAAISYPYYRREFVVDAGWATMPGTEKPNQELASACAKALAQDKQT